VICHIDADQILAMAALDRLSEAKNEDRLFSRSIFDGKYDGTVRPSFGPAATVPIFFASGHGDGSHAAISWF
jgi:hypothetical protein